MNDKLGTKYRITFKHRGYQNFDSMQKSLAWAFKWGKFGVFLYAIHLNIGAWTKGHKSFTYWLWYLKQKPVVTKEKIL